MGTTVQENFCVVYWKLTHKGKLRSYVSSERSLEAAREFAQIEKEYSDKEYGMPSPRIMQVVE